MSSSFPVTGFGQSQLKAFLDGTVQTTSGTQAATPYINMCAVLEMERYDPVRAVLEEVGEGRMSGYRMPLRPDPEVEDNGADGASAPREDPIAVMSDQHLQAEIDQLQARLETSV